MSAMPGAPLGIFKCRDLATLYYGVRIVGAIVESKFTLTATPQRILAQDPRRIRYEISFNGTSVSAASTTSIGTRHAIDTSTAMEFDSEAPPTYPLVRDFLTDLDAVTIEQWATDSGHEMILTVRETFLTPAGVDESLLEP
jgi:hypothetical protein